MSSDIQKLYGTECQEGLYDTVDEVIEEVIAGNNCHDAVFPIKVYEFERRKPDVETEAYSLLDSLLENLDEEYGDPDGDHTTPTEKMKSASKEFIEKVLEDYFVWGCVRTGKVIEVQSGDYPNE